eukprot:6187843-Amphidinium_carterae.1
MQQFTQVLGGAYEAMCNILILVELLRPTQGLHARVKRLGFVDSVQRNLLWLKGGLNAQRSGRAQGTDP